MLLRKMLPLGHSVHGDQLNDIGTFTTQPGHSIAALDTPNYMTKTAATYILELTILRSDKIQIVL